MPSLLRFFKYNNAVPVIVSVVLLGAGSAFAATNPDAILASHDEVQSVDNSYIVNADLAAFNFHIDITGVTEDTDLYYVAYSYHTIGLDDSVWKDLTRTDVLKVSKKEITGKDLGLFAAKQLGEILTHEMSVLDSTQAAERAKGATPKVVATEYSGLVGKFLSPSEKTLPGYTPVVVEATTSDVAAAVVLAPRTITDAPSGSTAPAPVLTQDQIEQLIQQRVNDILAQKAGGTPLADTSSVPPPVSAPPPESPPATTTTTASPAADTSTTTPPVEAPPVSTPATTTPDTPPETTTPPVVEPASPPATGSTDTPQPPAASDSTPTASSTAQ